MMLNQNGIHEANIMLINQFKDIQKSINEQVKAMEDFQQNLEALKKLTSNKNES